jgi:hypothetical protein
MEHDTLLHVIGSLINIIVLSAIVFAVLSYCYIGIKYVRHRQRRENFRRELEDCELGPLRERDE